MRELSKRVSERLRWTALVRLDHDAKSSFLTGRGLRHEIFERHDALRRTTALGLAVETLATLSDLARFHRVFNDDELITSHRHAADAQYLRRNRGTCFLDIAATLVEQRSHLTGIHAADEIVTDPQGAVVDEDCGDGSLTWIELSFN